MLVGWAVRSLEEPGKARGAFYGTDLRIGDRWAFIGTASVTARPHSLQVTVNDSVEEASLNSRGSTGDDFETYRVALMAEVEVAAVTMPSIAHPVPRISFRP